VARSSSGKENALDLNVGTAVGGISGFGVMVLMIMASLTVTSEIPLRNHPDHLPGHPASRKVIATKAGLVGVYGALLNRCAGLCRLRIAKAVGGDAGPESDAVQRFGLAASCTAFRSNALLCVILAVGVGVLVRQSAAATFADHVLWPLLIEPLLGAFGSFRPQCESVLPFSNASHFYSSTKSSAYWHWGPWGSLLYFAVSSRSSSRFWPSRVVPLGENDRRA